MGKGQRTKNERQTVPQTKTQTEIQNEPQMEVEIKSNFEEEPPNKKKTKRKKNVTVIDPNAPLMNSEHFYIMRYIAIATMVIDHIAIVLASLNMITAETFTAFRMLGRLSFPIFAMELVESFHHTANKKKHLCQIGILAIVSEVPYDVALILDKPTEYGVEGFLHQSICVEFFLAYLMLWIFNLDWNVLLEKLFKKEKDRRVMKFLCCAFILAVFSTVVHYFVFSDCGGAGILCVGLFELAKHTKHKWIWQILSTIIIIGSVTDSLLGFIPAIIFTVLLLTMTNKKANGNERKTFLTSKGSIYFCRAFYPVHLILLAIFRAAMVK